MKNLFIGLVIGLSSVSAFAQIGNVAIGGNGCPQGEVYFSTVEDKMLIEYSKMHVDNQDGKTVSRVSCNLRLPIMVPAGLRLVATLQSDATVSVWANNKVILSQELFIAGQTEVPHEEQLQHHGGEVFLSSAIATTCAASSEVVLAYNLNATLMNISKQVNSSAYVTKSVLDIKFESCFDSEIPGEDSVGELQLDLAGN